MAAGIADRVWALDDLIALLDEAERAVPQKRGPYKKRTAKSTPSACNIGRMGDPRDHRTRNVDPFNAPEDYADPWRGRNMPILVAAVVLIALIVVGFYLA